MKSINYQRGFAGLATALFVGVALVAGFLTSAFVKPSPNTGATNAIPTPVALFETTLANSITSSATSFTLTGATDKDGNALASSTYAFIIDEGTANEEFVIADCTATACTGALRGVSVLDGNTEVAALKKAHRRGASVKITDGPQLLILSRMLNGVDGIPNNLKYDGVGTFTTAEELVDKNYVDSLALGSTTVAATEAAVGFVELATQTETASSTATGSVGPLVLQAKYATLTAPASGNYIPVTGSDGNLDEDFIPTTLENSYTFSGTTTFSGAVIVPNPTIQVFTAPTADVGSATTQYDITNPSGTTFRYTYDGTGTDPNINATTAPTNTLVQIAGNTASISELNEGDFVVTGSGSNYFEVTNGSGVVESNVTNVSIRFSAVQTYTKPAGLDYVEIEVVGGGGASRAGDSGATESGGGGGGGYARKLVDAGDIGATESIWIGLGGTRRVAGKDASVNDGQTSSMTITGGSTISASGGGGGDGGGGGSSGAGSNGDINIYGQKGGNPNSAIGGDGGDSVLGHGGIGSFDTGAADGHDYGGGAGGVKDSDSERNGHSGGDGVVIITEFY